MRNFKTTAAGTAMLASAVNAMCATGVSTVVDFNYYCSAVDTIQYKNFGTSGVYQRVTNMDSSSGSCSQAPQGFSGGLAPMDQEVSLHYRGPLHLVQFAHYVRGKSHSKRSHLQEHGHAHVHEKRDVGDWVTVTMDGQVVSWINQYGGQPTAAPVPNTSGSDTSGSAGSAGSSGSNKPASGKVFTPSYSGDWVRDAHYRAAKGKAEGLTFLNNMGGGASGVFDYSFGSSLSYATSNGQEAAAGPEILNDQLIPSNTEVIMMSDKPCSDPSKFSCGYSRPGTVAHHGFENDNAVYLFQFSMPNDGSTVFPNGNMPALWMLNAQIPRTLQYGNAECSCWKTGCGEFDIFEVLSQGDSRAKSTLHGVISGGDSDYFNRPEGSPIKLAVSMINNLATIKVLPDNFDFSETLTNAQIEELGSHSTGGLADALGTSVFNLAELGTKAW